MTFSNMSTNQVHGVSATCDLRMSLTVMTCPNMSTIQVGLHGASVMCMTSECHRPPPLVHWSPFLTPSLSARTQRRT